MDCFCLVQSTGSIFWGDCERFAPLFGQKSHLNLLNE